MKHKQFGNKYVLRLEKGEEIVSSLKKFCQEQNVNLATFSAIGAADKIVLGLFKTAAKDYVSKEFADDYEILSLTGNITQMDGQIYLHAHAVISDVNNRCFGGHLSSAIISGTLEAVIEKIEGEVGRKFNNDIGLNLLDI